MSSKCISVISRDRDLIKFIKDSLENKLESYEFFIASSSDEAKEHMTSMDCHCSIIILDGACIDILDQCKDSVRNDIPILIMIDRDADSLNTFDFDRLNYLNIYDFIRRPFLDNIFYNKVKLLVKLSESNRILNSDRNIAISHLWSLLNYTNMFVMVVDDKLTIKMANYPLIKFMGLDHERDAVGVDWMKFIPEIDKESVIHTSQKLVSGEVQYAELTNDIFNETDRITVRWFTSYVNNKTHWMFCIGVPLSHSISTQENVETIRAYYRDIIMKDKEMIKNIKEVTSKYSQEMFGDNRSKWESK